MSLLTVSNITKVYNGQNILNNISLTINKNEKVALVGPNGAGKTTLLNIITNKIDYDSGEIFVNKQLNIGYFSQKSTFNADNGIFNELLSYFKNDFDKLKLLEQLSEKISSDYESDDYEKYLEKYNRLQDEIIANDIYNIENRVKAILTKFGFGQRLNENINTLSGGEKTRLALAKILIEQPDFLILDEPTNHLDIETVEWLETYLRNYQGTLVLVSHDRYFLDEVVNVVYEITRGKVKKYVGNYTKYMIQKEIDYHKDLKEYNKQQKEIAKLEDFVRRNIARASTSNMAKSRLKMLERIDVVDKPVENKTLSFKIKEFKQSGKDIFIINNLAIGYDTPLVNSINLRIDRQDRVAIIGPNGIGKSTFLKTLIDEIPSLGGEEIRGKNINLQYFNQDSAHFPVNKNVLHAIWDEHRYLKESELRTYLGQFLFTGDDVFKTISSLSGGELVRLSLCNMMLCEHNVLILDEPTNHLDIASKEALEDALNNYPGTIIFVSHDRYFIDSIATKTILLSSEKSTEYLGNYSYYVEKIRQEAETVINKDTTNKKVTDYETRKKQQREEEKRKRQIKVIEEEIAKIEEELESLNNDLLDPNVYNDYVKAGETQEKITSNEELLDQYMTEWESLH